MRAIVDAGPLIHLSWIDQLDLLHELFDEGFLPPAVQAEVLGTPVGTPGLDQIIRGLEDGWLIVKKLSPQARQEAGSMPLDRGESEALALAGETEVDVFVSDDTEARSRGEASGLEVTGTVGILIFARERKIIPAVLPLLLRLRAEGQWLSDEVIRIVESQEAR